MKTLIAFFTIAAIACSSFAQDQKAAGTKTEEPQVLDSKMKKQELRRVNEMVIMRAGQMMLFKNGQITQLDKDMKMKNGTIVKPDGTVKMIDGSTRVLKNGERIDMDGNLTEVKKPANKPTQPQKKTDELK